MSLVLDALTIITVSAGAFFFLAGTVGLLRFPDALSRLHALTKADNLGLGLVVLGLLFQVGRAARRTEAYRRLAPRSAGRSHRHPTDCAHRPTGWAARVTSALAFDVGLAVLVLGLAVWTVAARDTFAAVVGFVAFGLLLALVWVRLAAPDVALTEAAIGGGVTGGLLVAASARLRPGEALADGAGPRAILRLAAAALCTLVTAGLAAIVLLLPEPAPTLAPQAAENLAATGLGNPVTAVLMAYRAIDTLLETVVLLLALLGVWSLAPDRVWGGMPAALRYRDANGALTFLAQLLAPVGILVGIHIFWIGSIAPGGEFQGATVLAAMWILAMMAGLVDAPEVSRRWLRLVLVAGPATFLAIGLAGFAMAGAFLAYPESHAKLLILTIEMPVTLSIAATLALLVAGPPERVRQQ